MQPRLPSLLAPPLLFGHRGARAHAPDNTMAGFRLALRLGATGLESDVWLTSDGVPVLDHDGVVAAGWRRRPISAYARAALPEHIPSLEDLLVDTSGDVPLALDIKDPEAGLPTIAVIRASAPDLVRHAWLCHPSMSVLSELRAHDREIRLVNSTRLGAIKEGPERRAASLTREGIDAVNLHHTDWTGGLTTLFHRFGRYCFAWDLQFPPVLRTALRMGMDAVFSDWVDRMVEAAAAEAR